MYCTVPCRLWLTSPKEKFLSRGEQSLGSLPCRLPKQGDSIVPFHETTQQYHFLGLGQGRLATEKQVSTLKSVCQRGVTCSVPWIQKGQWLRYAHVKQGVLSCCTSKSNRLCTPPGSPPRAKRSRYVWRLRSPRPGLHQVVVHRVCKSHVFDSTCMWGFRWGIQCGEYRRQSSMRKSEDIDSALWRNHGLHMKCVFLRVCLTSMEPQCWIFFPPKWSEFDSYNLSYSSESWLVIEIVLKTIHHASQSCQTSTTRYPK